MDRNSILRIALIAGAILILWKFVLPRFSGDKDTQQSNAIPAEVYVNAPGFVPDPTIDPPADPTKPNAPVEDTLCTIKGDRYDAIFSARGAGLTHFYLRDAKYAAGAMGYDVSTTDLMERWRNLRTLFRSPSANDQLKYDRFNWTLQRPQDDKSCTFTYEDPDVRITKSISASARPFELNVETTVTNLADTPKHHQFSIAAASYRENKALKGSLGRVSPFQTDLDCASGKDVTRKNKDDFKSGWISVAGTDRFAAVNSHYFAQALVPMPGDSAVADIPQCEILAEEWYGPGQAHDADDAANVFHARLVYPPHELQGHASATYRNAAFFGPKEREVLAAAAGGKPHLGDVINLGFFTPVAKFLVGVLVFMHDHITLGNWGLAIIVMTICVRLTLFPLTYKSIKTTIAMRKLKPELDELNAKFKDDAQSKQLATMELYKKRGVNPFGGCLPQLVQMPVWFAMYTTLQTAVEMYHVKFLWFQDLSSPDKFYILPLLLGVFMIVQQRIVPQQGMDPMQAKMMMWMMPAIFTVMMLFLPAALGVYMLTNSILGITQQLVVEQVSPRSGSGKDIVVKTKDDKPPGGLRKEKARV